jgi:hypothetical protein
MQVPPTLTRTADDVSLTAVYVAFAVTQAKPVVAMPVYVRYHLTVPNGSTLDADKTTTCQ